VIATHKSARFQPRLINLGAVTGLWLAVAGLLLQPARGDEFGGLGPAFRRAQQMVEEARRTNTSRPPAGRTLDDYSNYSNQAQHAAREAAARMAEVDAQMAGLDAATRSFLEQNTSAADRSSVASLMDAILGLQRDARARQYELLTRVAGLRRQMDALLVRLSNLDLAAGDLRDAGESLTASLTELRQQSAALEERVAKQAAILTQTKSLLSALQNQNAAAQSVYWEKVGDTFARLGMGTPRNYTAAVEAEGPTTQRRVHRSSMAPVPVPALAMPLAAASVVAFQPVYAVPALAAPLAAAAMPVQPPSLINAVNTWLNTAQTVYRAQGEADSLLHAVEETGDAIEARTTEIEQARARTAGLQSDMEQACAELNRQAKQLEFTQVELSDSLTRGVRSLGEGLFWAHAQDLLQHTLRGVSHHAELAAHFTWVVRSYATFLRDDLPRAIDLLGPNPSDEALASYERLTHLTELYVMDREVSMVVAQVTSSHAANVRPVKPLDLQANFRRQKANLDEFIREARTIWSPTDKKTPLENAFGHWRKHAAEFPEYEQAGQYFDGAKSFFRDPPAGTLTKVRSNGEKIFYFPERNVFGVQATDGSPHTFFKPDPAKHGRPTNLDYFNDQ